MAQHKSNGMAFLLPSPFKMLFATTLITLVIGAWAVPTVTVRNGTYIGLHSESYNQDIFLGMPYAKAPVGDLRLVRPQSLNQSWNVPRRAITYGDSCPAYVLSEFPNVVINRRHLCLRILCSEKIV
jgi:hypothetical protein